MSEANYYFDDSEQEPDPLLPILPGEFEADPFEVQALQESTRAVRLVASAANYITTRVEQPTWTDDEKLEDEPHPLYAAVTIALRETVKLRGERAAVLGLDNGREIEPDEVASDNEAALCLAAAFTLVRRSITEQNLRTVRTLSGNAQEAYELAAEQANIHPVTIALEHAWKETAATLDVDLISDLED
jgi:hypothetical protein